MGVNLSIFNFNIMEIFSFFQFIKKSHKLFFLKLIIIFTIIVVFDHSIGAILRSLYFNQINGNDYRLIEAILKTNEDIIILGDSRAQHHYVPSVIEKINKLSCFNSGRAGGQSIIYHYAIFNSTIRRYKPKLFILNISPYELLKEVANNEYDKLSILLPFANRNKTIGQIIKLRGPFESIKNISAIYPFNSKLITMLYHNPNRVIDDNGYIPRIGSRPILPRQVMDYDAGCFDSLKVKYFRTLMNEAKINSVRIIVVISPQYNPLPQNKSINYIKNFCSKENIQFIDYSNDNTFQKHNELFNDAVHLNDDGAKLFSTMVANKIKKTLQESNLK